MSYIWVDLWNKRCWLAVEVEGIVIPKSIVSRVDIIKEIKKLINDYNIKVIVVWLPYDLYNKDNRQLDRTKKFVEKLKNIFDNIKIETVDERFTSFEADNILWEMWVKDTMWQKDDLSAALILETYIKTQK